MNKPAKPVETEAQNDRLGRVRAFWNWLTRTGEPRAAQPLSASDLRLTRATFRDALAGTGGEASARQRIATLATLYRTLNDEGRRSFLGLLAEEFGPDEMSVNRAIQAYLDAQGPGRRAAESELRLALGSPRIRIVKQFNLLPEGVKFLVDVRADVLRYLADAPQLEVLDEELSSLFASWFDIGNLELRRISWSSPAALLEKLIAYEAVHEIRSWTDLRNRLDSDRRCYAFFHPRMPDEPLIFVEIALVKDMADNIHGLLDESAPAFDPHAAQAAIFYSISNTQAGLKGVSFGGFLIKRVADMLAADFPKLKVFATLSPVPGFRRWLDAEAKRKTPDFFGKQERDRLCEEADAKDPHEALAQLLLRGFASEAHPPESVKATLMRLCAHYLVEAKEGGDRDQPDTDKRPLDPVARFHLGNGARLERINWLADTSPRGIKQSAGLMVNYLYKLDEIEDNHEAFEREGRVVIADAVKRLLRKPS
ncbi:MAG TPA: malonyl-CoA decarboxylase [Burkholderiales bacterium]|nr:malonyl-CoA decarboxylase [Burkholderiales bacterium]